MAEHLKGVGVGSGTSTEHPSIVQQSAELLHDCSLAGCLHHYKLPVQHNLPDGRVLHQRVFHYHLGIAFNVPVDFIDGVLVGQSHHQLIVHVIAVHTEPAVVLTDVESPRFDGLAAGDVNPINTRVPVQEEQLSLVQLHIHNAEFQIAQHGPIQQRHQIKLHVSIDQKHLNIGVVLMLRIHPIPEMRPQQVAVPRRQVAIAHQLASANPAELLEHGSGPIPEHLPTGHIHYDEHILHHRATSGRAVHDQQPQIGEPHRIEAVCIVSVLHHDSVVDPWYVLIVVQLPVVQQGFVPTGIGYHLG